jgi:putative peptidoglycan lipid II flippase
MLMLNVPATIGLIVLANPIVGFLLQRGRFSAEDTASTAAALMFYAPGLVGYSAVKIASPTFYSLRESRTPVVVSVLTVLINLILNVTLVRVLGFRGLALGTAIASIFNAAALLWMLRARLDGLDGGRVGVALVKIVAASLAMGAAAWWVNRELESILPAGTFIWKHIDMYLSLRLLLAIVTAVGVLIATARLLRIAELDEASSRVLRRVGVARGAR